jgi:hypothetical protein
LGERAITPGADIFSCPFSLIIVSSASLHCMVPHTGSAAASAIKPSRCSSTLPEDAMISGKQSNPAVFLFLGAGVTVFIISTFGAFAQTPTFKKDECARCHPLEVSFINEAGGKHRNVPCVGCHPAHPPDTRSAFSQCNRCHLKSKKSHFQTPGCITCHTNPHTPLKITFNPKARCLNCHELQREQLAANPSKHSELGCAFCHEVHRKKPECVQCHNPHPDTLASVCRQCHNPHMPKVVTYPPDTPSTDCAGCHPVPARQLSANTTKHHLIACARCHQQKHKVIPTCISCHGTPHPQGIRNKFTNCGQCHNTAHDLNNWSSIAQEPGRDASQQ